MIELTTSPSRPTQRRRKLQRCKTESSPLPFVTRYCSVEPSSVTAAVHDGLRVLDKHMERLAVAGPHGVLTVSMHKTAEAQKQAKKVQSKAA